MMDIYIYCTHTHTSIYTGLGPLVARGNPCCAVPVPFYVDNALADLEPSKGAASDPAWPWPGYYKALDIFFLYTHVYGHMHMRICTCMYR